MRHAEEQKKKLRMTDDERAELEAMEAMNESSSSSDEGNAAPAVAAFGGSSTSSSSSEQACRYVLPLRDVFKSALT